MEEDKIEKEFLNELDDIHVDEDSKVQSNVSTSSIFEAFLVSAQNERCCENILEYKTVLVESLKRAVSEQDQLTEDCAGDAADNFLKSMYQFEVRRIKFILTEYHRVRLQKIRRYALYIVQNPEVAKKLSAPESVFCSKLLKIIYKLDSDSFLASFPKDFSSYDTEFELHSANRPDESEMVFFKAMENIDTIQTDEETEEMRKDETGASSYKFIKNFLESNLVKLL
eukprot:snap_masked-scaffold_6-processed-gene-3.34-mRNA-1 protein AED:1.00 eAED:1.00 QI:0/0/0/0/1/1/2/0/225